MLHSEFTQRVQFEVSNEEFEAIHVVYMASDLDKDEFCAMWRKMNAKRIKAAKEEEKAERKAQALKERMWKYLGKLGKRSDKCCLIYDAMNEKEEKDLIEFGIELTEVEPINGYTVYRYATSVWLDLNYKLHGIA